MTLTDGLLLVDKPEGPTSHDVVGQIRRALHMRRVGHAGTLDPFASGLLLVLTGRATRLTRFLVGLPKRYEGEIVLGTTTNTDDVTGVTTSTTNGWRALDDAAIAKAMHRFVGTMQQRPPAFSAKHVDGTRAYRMARRGAMPNLPPQTVEILSFAPTGRDGPLLRFEAHVGSGTYLRALARDLGGTLGCGAHLATLRRTDIGAFAVTDALPPARVAAEAVRNPIAAVGHLAHMVLNDDQRALVVHGRSLERAAGGTENGSVAMVHDGVLVAVAEVHADRLKPRVVLEDR